MGPVLGYWPSISRPRSFNEKIVHRKVCDYQELFSLIADKWEVRNYVREHVGKGVLAEVYQVIDDSKDLEFESLPDEFVMKLSSGSGQTRLIHNKEEVTDHSIQSQCHDWLRMSFGGDQREYWYSEIQNRIIFEELLRDEEGKIPRDYKMFVFHGTVVVIQVDFDRFSNHRRRFFTSEWDPLEFRLKYPLGPMIDAPPGLDRMIKIAETLGGNFDFVRVDLYNPEDETVIFGEMTLAPGAGNERFFPKKEDFKLGSHW